MCWPEYVTLLRRIQISIRRRVLHGQLAAGNGWVCGRASRRALARRLTVLVSGDFNYFSGRAGIRFRQVNLDVTTGNFVSFAIGSLVGPGSLVAITPSFCELREVFHNSWISGNSVGVRVEESKDLKAILLQFTLDINQRCILARFFSGTCPVVLGNILPECAWWKFYMNM